MIVVAHPDDELLGLGATMHRLIAQYHVKTQVVILGEGITSRAEKRDLQSSRHELEMHKTNIHKAQASIGYHSVSIFDFPDNRFDSVALLDIIKVVEKEKSAFKPDVIFTHHSGDLNVDHRLTFEAVMTACRPMAHEYVRSIISFETPSGTEWISSSDPKQFVPNLFFEVSEEDLQSKISGMESYDFEKRPYPHPRSPEALRIHAQYRGITVGCNLAEAFYLVRSNSML